MGHFIDESLQSVTCTGTDNQINQETESRQTHKIIANNTIKVTLVNSINIRSK